MPQKDYKNKMEVEIANLEQEEQTPETKEAIAELRASLEKEVEEAIEEFKEEDKQVEEIERSIDLNNESLINEVKEEIQLDDSLQKIDNQAILIEKDTLSEIGVEKSFWGHIESTEEKLQKVEELFIGLDTRELEREDIETKARGYNVTNNIEWLNGFKKQLIEHISNDPRKSMWGSWPVTKLPKSYSSKRIPGYCLDSFRY